MNRFTIIFVVLTAVNLKVTPLRHVAPCDLVNRPVILTYNTDRSHNAEKGHLNLVIRKI
jgi:hypothetical protein